MTKEEVAQVIAYCDENKISYKQRLAELGINPWNFYDAKLDHFQRGQHGSVSFGISISSKGWLSQNSN